MPDRVHLISLGCPKNQVDSEFLLGALAAHGAEIADDPAEAQVILINTCAFIRPAVEEAVDTILEMAEVIKTRGDGRLVVLGCLPERYGERLEASLPEVDLFWGSGRLDLLPDRIEALRRGEPARPPARPGPGYAPSEPGPRLRAAPFFRAYLKIAEGCSNGCSYCLIPRLRGPLRSRPLATLVAEAEALAADGVRELILVAQDTTAYGRDLKGPGLSRLLRELAGISGLDWLRVMYAYPSGLTDELIETMATLDQVCAYLDLPLQHTSPAVLRAMNREASTDLSGLIRRLREGLPDLNLRTTFMVGFPGETEADFAQLLDFVATTSFERLGVFKFSAEEGTRAATRPDQVPQRLKENRRRKLMALQRRISRAHNRTMVGRTMPVLVEGFSPETDLLLVGRTAGQAPGIDGQVFITRGRAAPGEIRPVRITQAHDYDLVGEIED